MRVPFLQDDRTEILVRGLNKPRPFDERRRPGGVDVNILPLADRDCQENNSGNCFGAIACRGEKEKRDGDRDFNDATSLGSVPSPFGFWSLGFFSDFGYSGFEFSYSPPTSSPLILDRTLSSVQHVHEIDERVRHWVRHQILDALFRGQKREFPGGRAGRRSFPGRREAWSRAIARKRFARFSRTLNMRQQSLTKRIWQLCDKLVITSRAFAHYRASRR